MPLLDKAAQCHERALSLGYAVPEGTFTGVVHSVYAHSCNLALAGTLVTLHDSTTPHTPTSIRLAGRAGHRWHPPVGSGQAVSLSDGLIRVGGSGAGAYTVDIAGAEVWRPRHPQRIVARGVSMILLQEVTQDHPLGGGNRPDLHSAADGLRRALMRYASTPAAAEAVSSAAGSLIGLGPGLTPSGDDLLVGLLGALARGSGARARGITEAVTTAIAKRGSGTTDVSRHYLGLAAEGKFSQPLTELFDSLAEPGSTALQGARIQQLLSVGATSGADAVAGVALGLAVLTAEQSNVSTKEKVL